MFKRVIRINTFISCASKVLEDSEMYFTLTGLNNVYLFS